MKAAFYFSKTYYYIPSRNSPKPQLTIDGKPFTGVITLEDDAIVESLISLTDQYLTEFPDSTLVTVVEGVNVNEWNGVKSVLYSSGVLKGRIKINDVTQ